MNLHELFVNGGGLLVLLLTLIQIAPIKINPWSAAAKVIGRAINQDLTARVDQLGSKVDAVEKNLKHIQAGVCEQNAVCCRVRILRFGDEVLHGIRHSKDHFDQILSDITDYNQYCREHPEFRNNMTELTSHRIEEIYSQRLEKNDFL